MNENPIDFVVTWVDGNDRKWQEEKNRAKGIADADDRVSRYRDWDTLRYWFRGVEQFAPWVRKVFIVTCGHYPQWLNLNCPKLRFVTHKEFIPEEYLPTFSCRPIEFNLHRIPGLSNKFVYFNDDMFLTQKVEPIDFFKNGLPCDSAILDALSPTLLGRNGEKLEISQAYSSMYYNTAVINRNFNKQKSIRENWKKWASPLYGKKGLRTLLLYPWNLFTGFKSDHLPYSYVRETYEVVWEKERDVLERACMHKFRDPTDVSSRLLSFWQIAEGKFSPRSPNIGIQTFICNDENENRKTFELIRTGKYKMMCINDEYGGDSFDAVKYQWHRSFEELLSQKSSFER